MDLAAAPGVHPVHASHLVNLSNRRALMFPEYRDLITSLKGHDAHFTRLFDKHNELDQLIKNKEAHIEPASQVEIEKLKKEKLALKDELYGILRQASS
jgi:uncharacterized protein